MQPVVVLVTDAQQKAQCKDLVHKRYSDLGVGVQGQYSNGQTIAALNCEKVVATLTLFTAEQDLPLFKDYKIVEIGRMASQLGYGALTPYLYRFVFQSIIESNIDFLIISARPDHSKFYKKLFGFKKFSSGIRTISSVAGATSELLICDCNKLRRKVSGSYLPYYKFLRGD